MKSVAKKMAAGDAEPAIDTRYLETLMGYNARRAALKAIALFSQRMVDFGLTPVDFSVLSLIGHNPGITSRQLCAALGILPPNLVGKISAMEQRQLVERKPHPQDGRAVGLHLSTEGRTLMSQAERAASLLEDEVTTSLTANEKKTLLRLLQKVYR
jgi:DNA-binding MarR family transcriptional regulator